MAKTHADKIQEALFDLGIASPNEIMDWIRKHYPEDHVNTSSYRADIVGCSINHSSSHHYPGMPKFLWFEEDTKKYRLANEEASKKLLKKEVHKLYSEDSTNIIDGIPIAKLSITGQVTIPSLVREKLGFTSGDYLAFIINDTGVLELRKAKLKIEYD